MAHIPDVNAVAVHRDALEYLPESVAREDSVLPVHLDGRTLRVIVPDSFASPDQLRDLLEQIEFLIDGKVAYDTADKAQIDHAVDYHYRRMLSEVANCPLKLRISCPRKWIDLTQTDADDVRYCSTCSQNVFLCRTAAELEHRARQNQCVAYHEYKSETIGLQMFPESADSAG